MKRVFLFVLDSCGCGEMPDAAKFGDYGVNTLKSCSTSDKLHIPTLLSYGLGNIDTVDYHCPPIPTASPRRCSSPSARQRAEAFWPTLPGPALR